MKKSRKANEKYNHLNKYGTYRARWDYIEFDEYLDGVKDKDGKQVMRPLTDDEKSWLNSFCKNTVHASFEIPEEVKKEKLKLKKLKSKHSAYKNENKKEHKEVKDQIKLIEKMMKKAGNLYYKEEDMKKVYAENYSRNHDLFNKCKVSGNLIYVDTKNPSELDRLTSESITADDAENMMMQFLDKKIK